MAVIKELVAKSGEYTNKQGEKKTRYIKVGVINQSDKGLTYRLESPFLPEGGMWLYERDIEKKDTGHNPVAAPVDLDSDSVPF
jgi:hypothetical protein